LVKASPLRSIFASENGNIVVLLVGCLNGKSPGKGNAEQGFHDHHKTIIQFHIDQFRVVVLPQYSQLFEKT